MARARAFGAGRSGVSVGLGRLGVSGVHRPRHLSDPAGNPRPDHPRALARGVRAARMHGSAMAQLGRNAAAVARGRASPGADVAPLVGAYYDALQTGRPILAHLRKSRCSFCRDWPVVGFPPESRQLSSRSCRAGACASPTSDRAAAAARSADAGPEMVFDETLVVGAVAHHLGQAGGSA